MLIARSVPNLQKYKNIFIEIFLNGIYAFFVFYITIYKKRAKLLFFGDKFLFEITIFYKFLKISNLFFKVFFIIFLVDFQVG